jgi:DNA adenine methylase
MPERGLFRWAGAKRHLLERVGPLIEAHRAKTGGRLISLFFGSGAIERGVGGCALAADASPELLQLYSDLQEFPAERVHRELLNLNERMPRTPEAYKLLGRAGLDPIYLLPCVGSARFLWLSAMAFNGVWRVNSAGEMNMGVDRARLERADVLPPLEAFQKFAEQIRGIGFVRGWENAARAARPGDLLFADPPYGEFDGYTAAGFESRDHRLLARALREGVQSGIAVIAFNAPEAASIYHWATCEEVSRSGCVSSKSTVRDPVSEIVITAGLRA